MQILDQAVEIMRKRGANGAQVAASFEVLATVGEEAARVWQGYLDKPGATGDKYTLVSWMGPDRANQLFSLSLKAKTVVDEIRAATGPQARFLVLDESPIVLAYAGLKEGETGPQAAQARLAAQQAMNKHLRELAGMVRSLKPGVAKAPAGKAAAKKKPATKKPAKQPARKPAKKK
jgi:hypothetical protein